MWDQSQYTLTYVCIFVPYSKILTGVVNFVHVNGAYDVFICLLVLRSAFFPVIVQQCRDVFLSYTSTLSEDLSMKLHCK